MDAVDPRDALLAHRAGDPDAFAVLVEAYRRPVYSYLVRCGVAPADRDDLFQAVFLRVHRAASTYRSGEPAHPWLFTIVANEVRRYFRSRRLRDLVFGGVAVPERRDTGADPERAAGAREEARRVLAAIHALPLPQREALLLGAVDELPLDEVGRILSRPVNTVKTHLRRARIALARALRGEELP